MKRYLTIDDLYNFYFSQNVDQNFNGNGKEEIVVNVDGKLEFSKNDALDGMMPIRAQMNFVGDNLNGSRIKMKAQEKALPSSNYRPILAYIHDVDGEPQFYGHNMHQDENGEIVYDESPVGVIAEEAHIEHDDKYDMDYAVANGYIWEEYSKAGYIINRDQKCDVSVELSIRSLSYDAKDKILNLDDFYYSGVTMLGVDENGNKVNPAMPGSNVTENMSIKDFTSDLHQFKTDNRLVEILEKLNTTLSNFNIEKSKEGGNNMFEALLEKYGKTVEDINFEYENLSDEELEAAFAEAFAESSDLELAENEDPAPASEDDETEEPESDEEKSEEPVVSEENSIECSVSIGEYSKKFSVSLNDKLSAITTLVNDTYSDDCTWYDCTVYDESREVVMVDFWGGKAYRQSYKVKDDVFTLKGDRVPVFSVWMTEDEQKAFEKMKADFSDISEKLAKYEEEPKKMEILNSDDYNLVCESEEFMSLKEVENHFDLSVEEVEASADKILNTYAKTCGRSKDSNVTFSEVGKENVSKKTLANDKKVTKESRYGNLFSVTK